MSLLFLLPLLNLHLVMGSDVRMPPAIVKGPEKDSHDYRDDDDYILECVAAGIPKPEYEWLKDDKPLASSGRRIIPSDNGSISIPALGTLDEGTYQCRAFNEYGVALTKKIVLRKAVLTQYSSKTIFEAPPLPEGTPYKLSCQSTRWHPKPSFSWTLVQGTEDKEDTPVILDRRIQIDEDGNLHFSYLVSGDSHGGKLYKCRLFNNILDLTIGGSYSRLNVTPVASIDPFPPKKMFSTESPVVGLETRQITMKCFFAGKPDPMLSWSKDGASLPIGRYELTNHNSELTIKSLRPTDTGIYRCSAQNTQSQNVSEVVEVKIQAVPVFRDVSEMPHDVNMTVGSDIVIKCRAYAVPSADVQWFHNGSPLDVDNLPRRFSLSVDKETLTISDLCKTCHDGSSDLMVIQCNASNVHGYAFEDGYINVLEETRITFHSENISMTLNEEFAELLVNATTDDLTPLEMHWYKLDLEDTGTTGRRYLHPDEPFVRISEDGKRVNFYLPRNVSAKRVEYHGLYEAVASNSYSADAVKLYLNVGELPAALPPPIASLAGIGELWWIILVMAGSLLLFILILLCCVCCYRNRGMVYPVDKKEKKSGNDPERELKDSAFFEYRRPEVLDIKGSQASLNSSMSMSDDEASLSEYGDIDDGKFTEEGTFVGDQAPTASPHRKKKKKKHSRESKA